MGDDEVMICIYQENPNVFSPIKYVEDVREVNVYKHYSGTRVKQTLEIVKRNGEVVNVGADLYALTESIEVPRKRLRGIWKLLSVFRKGRV